MEINKRNRTELKSYFVKNAIPTESNFADLIEGVLNQKEDGIVKLPGNPLSIEASGDDASLKKAINFYRNFNDANPDWTINLNPRDDPNNAGTSRLGLNISDGDGKSRLFIDRATGNVGVGTVSPAAKLHIAFGAIMPAAGNAETAGIMFAKDPGGGAADAAWIRYYARQGENTTFEIGTSSDPQDHIALMPSGNVGIGTTNPRAKLEVNGVVMAKEFRTTLITAGSPAAASLEKTNKWGDVPDMLRSFSLTQTTNALVYYQITMLSAEPSSHLVTRLLVDDKDVVQGRAITGNTQYWSPSSVWVGQLTEGSHTIKVQYRTPAGGQINPGGNDWQNKVLHILIFGSL